jgi:hypothetical protein
MNSPSAELLKSVVGNIAYAQSFRKRYCNFNHSVKKPLHLPLAGDAKGCLHNETLL